ncbi:hypothetical protein [Photobacterium sp. 1_MG-2023]|uniref:hypothetical protein n=1 Tax=Photobacterium sp. 1_MG-2023 TaxID=3062646 RepID=UPI0026E2AB84|nr:hypothetical protein [Photobacterium sp. 1_MG-2023]MDO6707952.1 hypothetical protein [Photobacterium sp. 1_MG-2023]
MASEKDLRCLMASRRKLWSPVELCEELDVHVCVLARLVDKARKAGVNIQMTNNEQTGHSNKLWLAEV